MQWLAMHVEIYILEQSRWSGGDLQPCEIGRDAAPFNRKKWGRLGMGDWIELAVRAERGRREPWSDLEWEPGGELTKIIQPLEWRPFANQLVAGSPPLNNQKFSFGHQLHSFINSIVGGNCFLAQTPCCHVRSTYLCNISNLYVDCRIKCPFEWKLEIGQSHEYLKSPLINVLE